MSQPSPSATGHEPEHRSHSRLLLTIAVWLLVLLLVVIAVTSAGARYLARNIDEYRPAIESLLSERLGQEVTIGGLSATWQGPDPVLRINNLDIAHDTLADARAVEVQYLLLRLDGPRSLWRRGLVFDRFEADGLELVLTRRPGRGLALDGLELPESGPGLSPGNDLSDEQWRDPQRWLDELASRIANPDIRLTHLTLGLQAPGSETVFVDIPQLDMSYRGESMSASGRAMRQGTLEQLATFAIRGQGLFDGRFSGEVWAEFTPGGVLEGITRGLQWGSMELQELQASAAAWLSFEDGQLQRLNGELGIPLVHVSRELANLPPLEQVSARIGWRRQGEGGSLHIRDLQWRWHDETVQWPRLKLDHDPRQWHLEATDVPVGPLVEMILISDLLSARIEPEIIGFRPAGQLSTLHLTVPREQPRDFEAFARLDGITIRPHRGVPGGSNLQGALWASRDGGRVMAQGQDMALDAPKLFSAPIRFSQAQGDVAWLDEGGVTRVFSRELKATYGESTAVEGDFDLRMHRFGENNLGLRIGISNARAAALPAVLPEQILDPALYQWLTTAITAGEVVSGEFYGHGRIGHGLPRNSFSTDMEYHFRDGAITYDPRWPAVTGANGKVLVEDGQAWVTLERAVTAGVQVDQAEVRVVDGGGAPTIEVTTSARVSGEDASYWLTSTPLADLAGEAGNAIKLGGNYQLDLALTVPLTAGEVQGIDLGVRTIDGSLRYGPADLHWQDINGSLDYNSRSGVAEGNFSARYLEQPVRLEVESDPARQAVIVSQSGRVEVNSLSRALMQGQAIPGLSGELDYTARLHYVPGDDTRLAIEANGAGLASQWPAPLAREPGPDETLEALLSWSQGEQVLLEARWGRRLSAALEWRGSRFRGGQVVINDGSARFPVEDGLMVRAAFEQFAPDQWRSWLKELGVAAGGTASGTPGAVGRLHWLHSIDVRMDELVLGDHVLPGIRVMARPRPDGWLLATNSERATGEVWIPDDGGHVTVDLDRLSLARDPQAGGQESGESFLLTPSEQLEAFRDMAAGQWPEVDVRIGSLLMGEEPAGAWSFVLSPSPQQITLMDLQGRLGSLLFDGQIRWGVTSGEQMTVLQGVLEGGGLQDLSALLGKEIPLANKSSLIDMNIAWPGRPDQFAPGRLSGEFSTRLDDGVILENNATAQLFRIFNLLNTDTLQRRLQFDFSDLYEAGIAFDAIYGKGRLDHGVLSWNPDLQLAGPSGALRLSGLTNLKDETLEMRLVVILPLTQNLPLAAILMGASPPVGGALFVLDKLLGEPLSKLTSATYSVRGTWDDPEVKLRNIFDSGNRE